MFVMYPTRTTICTSSVAVMYYFPKGYPGLISLLFAPITLTGSNLTSPGNILYSPTIGLGLLFSGIPVIFKLWQDGLLESPLSWFRNIVFSDNNIGFTKSDRAKLDYLVNQMNVVLIPNSQKVRFELLEQVAYLKTVIAGLHNQSVNATVDTGRGILLDKINK